MIITRQWIGLWVARVACGETWRCICANCRTLITVRLLLLSLFSLSHYSSFHKLVLAASFSFFFIFLLFFSAVAGCQQLKNGTSVVLAAPRWLFSIFPYESVVVIPWRAYHLCDIYKVKSASVRFFASY